MKRRPIAAALVATVVLAIAPATAGAAPPQRTFVASVGSDANPCSLVLPCRTFSVAVGAVATGGEVVALDSAGYGVFAAAKSVSVVAPPGAHAGVTAFAGAAILVSGPGIKVALRGLSLDGLGGVNGIVVADAATVQVDECRISGFTGAGIAQNAIADVSVVDTFVDDSGSGVAIAGGRTSLDRVRIRNVAGAGVVVSQGTVLIRESVITDVGGDGIFASVLTPNTARVTVVGTTIAHLGATGRGIVAEDASGFPLSASVVVRAAGNVISDGGGSGIVSQGTHATMIASRNVVSGMGGFGLLQQVIGVGPSALLISARDNVLEGNASGSTSGTVITATYF